jgi:dethiobiotin synthetase
MSDILVTGTDTGVGKTVIAAALVLALRERHERVVGWKPAETGVAPRQESDSEVLAKATGLDEPRARPLLRLTEPLAPAVAAERARVVLDPRDVEQRLRDLRAAGYRVVVEGAGGLLVPLSWGYTALDLAERQDLEVVVVSRAGLGALNHNALTLDALAGRGVRVRGVVLNGRGAVPDPAEETNPDSLRRMRPGVRIVEVPRHDVDDALLAAYASVPLVVGLL